MSAQSRRSAEPTAFRDAWAATTQGAPPIPDLLRGLEAVLVALITQEGTLKDANRGFLLLMTRLAVSPETANVRDLFVAPRFEDIARRPRDPFEGTLHRGLITFGEPGGRVTSLRGAIYGHERDYLVVAEHDVNGPEALRTTLLELQGDLAEKQRHIAHLEHRVARLQELAEAALRDRDTLIDALAHGSVRPAD